MLVQAAPASPAPPKAAPKSKRGNKSAVEVVRKGGRAGDSTFAYFEEHGELPVSK